MFLVFLIVCIHIAFTLKPIIFMQKEVYGIFYYNGEKHDDAWSGILENEGVFEDKGKAENRIKQLQIAHIHRIKEETEEGYVFHPFEKETWDVRPIIHHL